MVRIQFLSLVALMSLSAIGCGPSAPPAPKQGDVKGTVTLDSKPMESGEVSFVIVGQPPSVLPVTNGAFSGKASIGANRVEVYSYRAGGAAVEMGGQKFGGDKENFIPAKFNADSTLKADVAQSGANDFKFDVTSK